MSGSAITDLRQVSIHRDALAMGVSDRTLAQMWQGGELAMSPTVAAEARRSSEIIVVVVAGSEVVVAADSVSLDSTQATRRRGRTNPPKDSTSGHWPGKVPSKESDPRSALGSISGS